MPTATKPKIRMPPIMIGMTLQEGSSTRQVKKKLEQILSGDERRRIKISPATAQTSTQNDLIISGPYTIFEKLGMVPVEYRELSMEYVPKEFPRLNPVLENNISGIPKILNRNRRVNRSFYAGGQYRY